MRSFLVRVFRTVEGHDEFHFFNTYEEARAILAEKSRLGHRAEVKAILTRYGVKQLSDVTDPKTLATLVAEAEAIQIG